MTLFGSSRPLLTASFPTQYSLFRPGAAVDLTVHISLANGSNGRSKLEWVEAELCGTVVTTYKGRKGGRNVSLSEKIVLFSQTKTVWTPSSSFSHPPSNVSRAHPSLDIPVHFDFPAGPLPPSFEGGTRAPSKDSKVRMVDGHEVARVYYQVKLHGKRGTWSSDERITLPFVYCPNSTFDDRLILRPLLSLIANSADLPVSPPPRPREGWSSMTREHLYREKMISKQSILIVDLSVPSLLSISIESKIPYRLSLLTLSPPVIVDLSLSAPLKTNSKAWSTVPPASPPFDLPDLARVELTLKRHVWTKCKTSTEEVLQSVGPVVDLALEKRRWFSDAELVQMNDLKKDRAGLKDCKLGETRWGVEIVVVGELEIGKGPTGGVGPSFGLETTKGMLECSYQLSIKIPRPGPWSDLQEASFVPLVLSARTGSSNDVTAPPGYYPVASSGAKGDVGDGGGRGRRCEKSGQDVSGC